MNKDQLDSYKQFASDKLGLQFNNINLLITALTHRSYVNEHKKSTNEHNERLEFLGDAVLELVTTDYLYRNYSEPEGVLTNWRAALVRTESNAAAGEALGYGPLVRMSKGEKNGSDRARQVILADAFEAVIGAIYIDQGYQAAEAFITKHIISKLQDILDSESWRDSKSYFQEISQRHYGHTPTYKILREDGPDHDKMFTVGVFIENQQFGTGTGHSKQEAEANAAAEGIKKHKTLTSASK
jgi:ribonuclease-3